MASEATDAVSPVQVATRRAGLADFDHGIAPAKAIPDTYLSFIQAQRREIFAKRGGTNGRQLRIKLAPVRVVLGRIVAKAAIRPAMETVIGDKVTLQPAEIEPET